MKHREFCFAGINPDAKCVCELKPQPRRYLTYSEAIKMLGEEALEWHLKSGAIKETGGSGGFIVEDESAIMPN